jgi:glycerol-3-phosphate dehydrogenase
MHSCEALAGQHFDVIIVGGGINGAGLTRDLTLRWRTAGRTPRILLLEKNFWGYGTSGRNSHLIHGGLRYLKYFDFRLVREALRERARLLEFSPDTVRPLRFELTATGLFEKAFYGAGIALYDLLAGRYRIGRSTYFGHRLSYWDAASDSAALVIDNVRDARHHGAVCEAGVPVTQLLPDGVILAGGSRVHALCVVDARGPWMSGAGLRLVRGSHIVLPRLYEGGHAIAHFHTDGRIIFFIPWGDLTPATLIGTTDVDHSGNADSVHISPDEVSYLRSIASQFFPASAQLPTLGCFSSLRPLLAAAGKSASATSREHQIEFSPEGILQIKGGKYTTYRAMAEEAARLICERIAPELSTHHVTRTTPFAVSTRRPHDIPSRIAWAQHEEGCRTLEHFLTCSTNWAWQRRWTLTDIEPIANAFGGGAEEFLHKYAPCAG